MNDNKEQENTVQADTLLFIDQEIQKREHELKTLYAIREQVAQDIHKVLNYPLPI